MKTKIIVLSLSLLALGAFSLNAQMPENDMDDDDFVSQPAMRQGMGPGMGGPGQMGPNNKQVKKEVYMYKKMGGKNMAREGFDMPEEVENKVLEVIKRNDSAFAEKLSKLKDTNEKKYDATIVIAAKFLNMGKMSGEEGIEKDIVRGISLEYDVRELSLKHENASASEKPKIKEEIKTKLNELFDIKLKGQEIRVKKMEKEIAELKEAMAQRKANKSKIVDQRLEQLTGNKYMSW